VNSGLSRSAIAGYSVTGGVQSALLESHMWQKILLGVGILGCLIGGGTLVVMLILVATQGGRISGDEAAPGFIGGGCCCSLSLVAAIIGLVFVLKGKKRNAGAGPGMPPSPPTPPAPPSPPAG
jgi:hypothetical protein